MKLFCGVYNRDNVPVNTGLLKKMARQVDKQAVPLVHAEENDFTGFLTYTDTSIPQILNAGNLTVSGNIHLYNRKALVEELGLDATGQAGNDIAIVEKAYIKWGFDCTKHFTGIFAFVIWDETKQLLFCCRDHLGQQPFFYGIDNNTFLFSSHFKAFFAYEGVNTELDDFWVLDYLTRHFSYRDRTVLNKVKRLMAGHYMIVDKRSVKIEQYWKLEDAPAYTARTKEEAIEGLKQKLMESVILTANPGKGIGIELSGGFDSSAIAAYAQPYLNLHGKSITAFSNVLPDTHKTAIEGFTDEYPMQKITADFLGIQKHILIDKPVYDDKEIKDKGMETVGYPSHFSLPFLFTAIYERAKTEGLGIIFSGFGGDELVSQKGLHTHLYSFLNSGKFAEMIKHYRLHGDSSFKAIGKTAYQYLLYLINTEKIRNKKKARAEVQQTVIKDELIKKFGLERHMLNNTFAPDRQDLKARAVGRINSTIERLETSYFMAERSGLEYVYPMLYVPLMEYFYALPDDWKAYGKEGRYLVREALKDMLPEPVRMQVKPINTGVVPYFAVTRLKDVPLNPLEHYLENLPAEHDIFRYIDTKKMAGKSNRKHTAINLAVYFDKMQQWRAEQ